MKYQIHIRNEGDEATGDYWVARFVDGKAVPSVGANKSVGAVVDSLLRDAALPLNILVEFPGKGAT